MQQLLLLFLNSYLSLKGQNQESQWWNQRDPDSRLKVDLEEKLFWHLKMNLSTVGADLDLRDVQTSCRMHLISSQVLLKLNSGAVGSTYKVYGINSHVYIEMDPETPVRISFISLNSQTNIEDLAWERKRGYYLSPEIEWGEEGITLQVRMLSGNLTLLPAI